MKSNYRPLWVLLFTAFVVIILISAFDGLSIGPLKLKSSGIVECLTQTRQQKDAPSFAVKTVQNSTVTDSAASFQPAPLDTASKTILFIGDSMLDGLSPRMGAYAKANGHKLYSVIWYSSTTATWGKSTKLRDYIRRIKPDYVFICLGANELFVKDVVDKRSACVDSILSDIGDRPYVWIGPPNWRKDTGINDLLAAKCRKGTFFKSDGMTFERGHDGAHPTPASAAEWMDSVARWMPMHSAAPIKMELPQTATARPARVFVHQPDEK